MPDRNNTQYAYNAEKMFRVVVFCFLWNAIVSDNEEDILISKILNKAVQMTKRGFIANQTVTEEKSKRSGPQHVILGRCDVYNQCQKGEYCEGSFCYRCKPEGDHCDLNGECCAGSECQYGFCTKGVVAGDPGTYCDLGKDCKGNDVCCIHELSISRYHSICKPMLEAHESCGPINLFHQDVLKAHVEPVCGPCKSGLSCKGVGILGRHSICLPETEE